MKEITKLIRRHLLEYAEVNEDLFAASNKIKPYEKLLLDAVVGFFRDEWNLDAQIIVKKVQNNKLIGSISLSDSSVNKNKFILKYNPNQSYREVIKSLIHELTHIKQISNGELRPRADWKALLWKDDFEISLKDYNKAMKVFNIYQELPWEKEAYFNMNDTSLRERLFNSSYWKDLRGKDVTLDYILDNI